MYKGLICIFAFLVFPFVLCFSQNVIFTGKIVDYDTKKTLDGASVYIVDSVGTIDNYAYSNEAGIFRIDVRREKLNEQSIIFSFLGYENQTYDLKNFEISKAIELKHSDTQLPEVKIISHTIKEQGDTLIYNVSRFKLPQDRSIADVLRNMPGIKVGSDGTILFQGEPINKFYIEGIDLLDEKYKLASNNLKANYVDEVQVLQQHEPIKSLRGKTFSEQAAINLILNEEAKAKWLTSIDFGMGMPAFLWDNRLMTMLLGKKSQNLSLYKNNNTGANISDEISSPLNISDIVMRSKIAEVEKPLFRPDITANHPLNKNRTLFNSSHLITSNQLWKFKKDKDIRLQVSYISGNEKQNIETEQQIGLGSDSTLRIPEIKKYNYRISKLESGLTYTHNASNFYIKNKISSVLIWDEQVNDINSFKRVFSEKYKLPQQSVRNDLRIVIPQKKGRWEGHSLTQYSSLNHDAFFVKEDNRMLSPYSQEYNFKNFTSLNQLSYTCQINQFQIKNSGSVNFQYQHLNSLLIPPLFSSIESSLNHAIYTNTTPSCETQFSYKSDPIDCYLNILFKCSFIELNNSTLQRNRFNFFGIRPSAGFKFYPSNWWSISFKGELTDDLSDIRTIYPHGLLINYRTLNSYAGIPTRKLSRRYIFSAAYRNPMNGLFMEISAGYTISNRPILYRTLFFDDIFQRNEILFSENKNHSSFLGINVSKTFGWWNTKLFLTSYYRKNKYSHILQNNQKEFVSNSFSIDSRIVFQPLKWVNNEYVFRYTKDNLDAEKMGGFAFSSAQHTLSSFFIPIKKFQIGIRQEFYKMQQNYYFIDCSASYIYKSIEVGAYFRNITNQNKYRYENITDWYKLHTLYYLRPREFLIKLSLAF